MRNCAISQAPSPPSATHDGVPDVGTPPGALLCPRLRRSLPRPAPRTGPQDGTLPGPMGGGSTELRSALPNASPARGLTRVELEAVRGRGAARHAPRGGRENMGSVDGPPGGGAGSLGGSRIPAERPPRRLAGAEAEVRELNEVAIRWAFGREVGDSRAKFLLCTIASVVDSRGCWGRARPAHDPPEAPPPGGARPPRKAAGEWCQRGTRTL